MALHVKHNLGKNIINSTGKVIIITGVAQGIGFACAERFIKGVAQVNLAEINA